MDWKTSTVIGYTNSFPYMSLQLRNSKKSSVRCTHYFITAIILTSYPENKPEQQCQHATST